MTDRDTQSSYTQSQGARDAEYKLAYEEWLAGMSKAERDKLPPELRSPDASHRNSGSPEFREESARDESPQIPGEEQAEPEDGETTEAIRVVMAHLLESPNPLLSVGVFAVAMGVHPITAAKVAASSFAFRESEVASMAREMRASMGHLDHHGVTAMRKIAAVLAKSSNASLTIAVMSLVTGIGYQGESGTEIAKRHGVTRAAVSKRCVDLAKELGLPPSRSMKSEDARGSYSAAQLDYWLR